MSDKSDRSLKLSPEFIAKRDRVAEEQKARTNKRRTIAIVLLASAALVFGIIYLVPPPLTGDEDALFGRARGGKCAERQISETGSLTFGAEISDYRRKILKARHTFENSAEQGDLFAQFCYATMYQAAAVKEGNYTDNKQMTKWYKRAADQGDMLSKYQLGRIYGTDGFGLRDHWMALRWYRGAAKLGDARAQYRLGTYYSRGFFHTESYFFSCPYSRCIDVSERVERMKAAILATRKNYTKARYWFELAADQNYVSADFWLDKLDEFGFGTGRD